MKVIIPTKNRAAFITTHKVAAFFGADVKVLVHDQQQFEEYSQEAESRGESIPLVLTGCPGDTFGLTRQREWACQNIVNRGEWFVFADDNIVDLQGPDLVHRAYAKLPVEDGQGERWRKVFGHGLTPYELRQVFAQDTRQAEALKAKLVGFATTGNHFFRAKKFRAVGYAIGKMMFWKNDPFRWDHTISMEDFRNTAEHLLRNGAVLIDNFVWPKCKHYERGGMGTYEQRIPQRTEDVRRLMAQYPGLFRIKNRKNFAPNTDLAVRFTSPNQVKAWRDGMANRTTLSQVR